jgi:hypothetical protein
MLAMFDDMNVTETLVLGSQYKRKKIFMMFIPNLTDVKSMNLIAKNEMRLRGNANCLQPYPSS